MLRAHLAVKHAPKRHTSDGLLAWHGTTGGGAVDVLTNLAQDATVRAQCAAAAAAASGDFWALEGSFERDLSLGYCSSAQGEQSLAHHPHRARAIGWGAATVRRPQCGLFADVANSDCETARSPHPDG